MQERHGGGLVIWIPDAIEGGIGDVFEGLVRRRNDLAEELARDPLWYVQSTFRSMNDPRRGDGWTGDKITHTVTPA